MPKMAPKVAKRSPKKRQDGKLGGKMGQDGAQDAAKCSKDGDLGSMLKVLGCSVGSFSFFFGRHAANQKL